MEASLKKIALELKRIRIELERQNSMVEGIGVNHDSFYIEEGESEVKPLENLDIENKLRGLK